MRGTYHIDDLFLNLKLTYSRALIELMEKELASYLKSVRKGSLPRYQFEFWRHEAKRSLRYSMFLRFYALFEAHIKEICDRHTTKLNLKLRVKDLSGKSFLDQADKFYACVIQDEPISRHRSWVEINHYAKLRNLIIHADGQISDNQSLPKEFSDFISKTTSLHIDRRRRICLRKGFCPRAIRHISSLLLDASASP